MQNVTFPDAVACQDSQLHKQNLQRTNTAQL